MWKKKKKEKKWWAVLVKQRKMLALILYSAFVITEIFEKDEISLKEDIFEVWHTVNMDMVKPCSVNWVHTNTTNMFCIYETKLQRVKEFFMSSLGRSLVTEICLAHPNFLLHKFMCILLSFIKQCHDQRAPIMTY